MQKMKQTKRYPSIGRCIYCGDASRPDKLTLEHIIPEAIGGELKFLGASCDDCQRRIERYEGRLNGRLFAGVRSLLRIAAKRSKPRQNVKLLQISENNLASVSYTSHANHPGYIILERLNPPIFQSGQPNFSPTREITLAVKNITATPTDKPGHVFSDFYAVDEYPDFTRLLAKIAHSFWIAERGDADFFPTLVDFIRGETDNGHNFFIGSNPEMNFFVNDLHFIRTGTEVKNENIFSYVDIMLFSCFQIYHGYRVYVGSLNKKHEFIFV